jgi:hypothetical protein
MDHINIEINDEVMSDKYRKNTKDVILQRFKFMLYLNRFIDTKGDHVEQNIQQNGPSNTMSLKIDDDHFIRRCDEEMAMCKKTIFYFFILEKITQAVNSSSMIFCILVANYNLKVKQIIGIMAVMFFISIVDSVGNWSRLREKYCNLYNNFKVLKYSTEPDRVVTFRKYAEIYNGDELFIDSVSST